LVPEPELVSFLVLEPPASGAGVLCVAPASSTGAAACGVQPFENAAVRSSTPSAKRMCVGFVIEVLLLLEVFGLEAIRKPASSISRWALAPVLTIRNRG